MLQGPRDSTPLTRKRLREIEDYIEEELASLGDFLAKQYSTIYISFLGTGPTKAAAELLYWPLRQLSDKPIYLTQGEEILYHTLPYHEEHALVILFSGIGTENLAAKASTTARVMETDILIVSTPIPSTLSQYLSEQRIELTQEPISISYIVAAAKIARILAKAYAKIEVRRTRIINEYGNIESIYDELMEKYMGVINDLARTIIEKERPYVAIYSSPTVLPASHLMEWYLSLLNIPAKADNLSALLALLPTESYSARKDEVRILIATDVEHDILREIRFKTSFTVVNERLLELIMHTDPLTAPLYASLIANKLYTLILGSERNA